MGEMLSALLKLQKTELDTAQVRRRLRVRERAVDIQQAKVDAKQSELDLVTQRISEKQRLSDSLDLDVKSGEEHVTKLRGALNVSKSNKEYSAILTQMNTIKADSAKVEEQELKLMAEIESLNGETGKLKLEIAEVTKRLEEVAQSSADEIARLRGMLGKLTATRQADSASIAAEALGVFERLVTRYDGEAMAPVQVQDKRRLSYCCGGCYMTLNAEHANALAVRDDIRTCDNCGRILYLEKNTQLA